MSKHLTQISFVLSETALASPPATAPFPDCPSLSIWQAVCQTQKKYLVDQSGSLVWPKGFCVPCPLLTPWISSYYNLSSPSSHHAFHSVGSPSLELVFHSSQGGSFPPFISQLKVFLKGPSLLPYPGQILFSRRVLAPCLFLTQHLWQLLIGSVTSICLLPASSLGRLAYRRQSVPICYMMNI